MARMIGEGSLTELVVRGERSGTVWEYIACPAKSKVLESKVLEVRCLEIKCLKIRRLEIRGRNTENEVESCLRGSASVRSESQNYRIDRVVCNTIAWPEQECFRAAGQNGKWINSRMTVKIIRQLEASCVSAVSVPEPLNRR
jgi:hypothetical protein